MAGFYISMTEDDDEILAKAEPTLIKRCRPSLTVLEKHGVRYVSLYVRAEDGWVVDDWVLEPRFVDGIRIPKKYHAEIREALGEVCFAVSKAIDAAINHGKGDTDDIPSSFYARVTIRQSDQPMGWSVYCTVSATVADDRPDLAIKLS